MDTRAPTLRRWVLPLAALGPLLSLVACGQAPPRPPGIYEEWHDRIVKYSEAKPYPCDGSDPPGCKALVVLTMETVHDLKKVIEGRPDAASYKRTIDEVRKLDAEYDSFKTDHCDDTFATFAQQCSFMGNSIIGDSVGPLLTALSTEDSLVRPSRARK